MASTVPNHYTKGRPHAMADPEKAQLVAQMLVDGATRAEVAEVMGVRPEAITRWKRDPRVQKHIKDLIKDRVYEITRKTDSEIASRLQNPQELTVKELLAIRSEFLGGQMREETTEVDEQAINEAAALLERNPDAAEQLRQLLKGQAPSEQVPSQN
jgi:transposase-like protein